MVWWRWRCGRIGGIGGRFLACAVQGNGYAQRWMQIGVAVEAREALDRGGVKRRGGR